MRYVYLNPNGEEEEFNDPCEKLKQNLMDQGYIFIKHIDRSGKEYPAECGRRVRLAQTEAFDEMLNKKIWSVDDKTQLYLWGIQ